MPVSRKLTDQRKQHRQALEELAKLEKAAEDVTLSTKAADDLNARIEKQKALIRALEEALELHRPGVAPVPPAQRPRQRPRQRQRDPVRL